MELGFTSRSVYPGLHLHMAHLLDSGSVHSRFANAIFLEFHGIWVLQIRRHIQYNNYTKLFNKVSPYLHHDRYGRRNRSPSRRTATSESSIRILTTSENGQRFYPKHICRTIICGGHLSVSSAKCIYSYFTSATLRNVARKSE